MATINTKTLAFTGNTTQTNSRKDNAAKWEELKNFVYNIRTREFWGRDQNNWVKFILFYSAFYLCLLAFFTVLLALALVCLDDIHPHMKGYESPLKLNPGLAYRPVSDFQSNLIRFVQGKPQSYKPFTDHIQTFLEQYENEAQVGENFIDCQDGRPPNSRQKVCRFNVDKLGDLCTWQKDYGYDEGQPCILFKLNKIYDWEPELFTEEDRPETLGAHFHKDFVGLTCEGEYETDRENIGNITIHPSHGFPKHFFPFLNQEGYRSPLAMIRFHNPSNGVVINIICKAWARNISHDRNDQAGLVRFQLMVD